MGVEDLVYMILVIALTSFMIIYALSLFLALYGFNPFKKLFLKIHQIYYKKKTTNVKGKLLNIFAGSKWTIEYVRFRRKTPYGMEVFEFGLRDRRSDLERNFTAYVNEDGNLLHKKELERFRNEI